MQRHKFSWIVLLALAGCQSWDLKRALYEGGQAHQQAIQLPAEAKEPVSYDHYQRERERLGGSPTRGAPQPSIAGPGEFAVESDDRLRVLPKRTAE